MFFLNRYKSHTYSSTQECRITNAHMDKLDHFLSFLSQPSRAFTTEAHLPHDDLLTTLIPVLLYSHCHLTFSSLPDETSCIKHETTWFTLCKHTSLQRTCPTCRGGAQVSGSHRTGMYREEGSLTHCLPHPLRIPSITTLTTSSLSFSPIPTTTLPQSLPLTFVIILHNLQKGVFPRAICSKQHLSLQK